MIRPQLCQTVEITPENLGEYLNDDDWCIQQKWDGQRFMVSVIDGDVQVYNRQGKPKTTMLTHKILGAFESFTEGEWWFDGELVGEELHLFDMPMCPEMGFLEQINPSNTFAERIAQLEYLFSVWEPENVGISCSKTFRTTVDKANAIMTAMEARAEGVIFKHLLALYESGRRSMCALKYKFTHSADVILTDIGVDGKSNALMTVLDPYESKVVNLGTVSTIGKAPRPDIGQVWEVLYLYCTSMASPKLVQPRLVRIRDDKDPSECLIDQLHFTDREFVLKTRSPA